MLSTQRSTRETLYSQGDFDLVRFRQESQKLQYSMTSGMSKCFTLNIATGRIPKEGPQLGSNGVENMTGFNNKLRERVISNMNKSSALRKFTL
jgi:hypothetical protein